MPAGGIGFALGLAGLMALVAVGTVHSGLLLRQWLPERNLLLSWPDNLLRLVLGALCVVMALAWGPGTSALGWDSANLVNNLVLGCLGGLALAVILGACGSLAVRRWGSAIYSPRLLQCILPRDRREWLVVLPVLILAAALEELLFRSLALGGLRWLVSPWILLWPLALFFGLLHWPQGWWGVAGAALAAVALSLIFLAAASIWAALMAHVVMNISQLLVAQWSGVRPLRASG